MSTSNRTVELAVIADNGFMIPSIVMLTSAKVNKDKVSNYRIHFICVGVCRFFKEKLMQLSSDDFEIKIYEADIAKYRDVNISIHVTPSTFLKLDIAQILPDVDKILHIDGDALVYSDLSELYEMEISDVPLGVVRAMSLEQNNELEKRTGVPCGFNAGIMLMNLKYWRNAGATSELCSMLLNAPKEWVFLEQDCLNVYFYKKVKYIHLKYNLISYVLKNRGFSIEEINDFYGTHYESYDDMCDGAVILHMAGTPNRRPWEVVNGVHGNVWQYYYDLSPLKHLYVERGLWVERRRSVLEICSIGIRSIIAALKRRIV